MTAVEDPAKTAAKQLEAFFLRQLLKEARPAAGGIDGGFAGETFKQMFDEALADKMAGGAGLGLANTFQRQLDPAGLAIAAQAPRALAPVEVPQLEPGFQFALPVHGRATSGYGERTHPINGTKHVHAGFDLAAPTGTRVGAAQTGEVTHAGPAGTYGNLVTIRHADGFETRYAHLSSVTVKKGDQVSVGQEVGAVGSTGMSTGPHLHFEIRKDGKALDPEPYLPLHGHGNRATR